MFMGFKNNLQVINLIYSGELFVTTLQLHSWVGSWPYLKHSRHRGLAIAQYQNL